MSADKVEPSAERSERMIKLSTFICTKLSKEFHSMRCRTAGLNLKERRHMIIASTLICADIQQEFIRYRRLFEARTLTRAETQNAITRLTHLIASFGGQVHNIQGMVMSKTPVNEITKKTLVNTFDEIVTLVDDIFETPNTYDLAHELCSSISNKELRDKVTQTIRDFDRLFVRKRTSDQRLNDMMNKADRLLKKMNVKSRGRTDDGQTLLNNIQLKK